MKIKSLFLPVAIAAVMASSCSTPQNIAYFQDVNSGTVLQPQQQLDIRVRPEDKLSIMVNTQDPALSALFNLVQVQNRLNSSTSAATSIGSAAGSGSSQVSFYTVDSNGDIMFPVLGKLHIGGMRREQVATYITEELVSRDLVKDPVVTVEFGNTGISVIGEVAFAMAGDLTQNGQRENVMVLRELDNGNQQAYRIDLTDATQLASSPVFYLQQNDVIYVEPNDKKKRETTPNGNTPYTPSFWVSMGSFAVTIATLVITLTR